MNVMKMMRRKTMMQPPDLRRRKADVGDKIVFVLDARGMSQYWAHRDHTATVEAVKLQPQSHRPSPRAVYAVLCECGMELNPRATAFEVA